MRIFTQYTTERGTDVLQDFLYTFDPMGNITWMKDEATQTIYFSNNIITPDKNYTYDAIYRLIEAQGREHIGQVAEYEELPFMNIPHPNDPQAMRRYSRSYAYDNSGNISEMAHTATGGNWTRDYSYTSGTNRIASTIIGQTTVNYTHDNNGNIQSLPNVTAFTWNFSDQVKEADLGGGGTAYYVYNAEGQRVRKVIHNNSDIKIKETIYLDGYEVYHEFVTGNVDFERETLHVMSLSAGAESEGGMNRVALTETKTIENGTPISTPTPRIRYQHSDHLGSCSVETTDTGALISFEEYYPYGGTSFQSTSSSNQVSAKRYRYNGKEKDEGTNLYYYGARYYISWLGRWMNCDPIGEEGSGLNLYRYASNNPIMRVDPTGMADETVEQSRDHWTPEPDGECREQGCGSKQQSSEENEFLKELEPKTTENRETFGDPVKTTGRNVLRQWYVKTNDKGVEISRKTEPVASTFGENVRNAGTTKHQGIDIEAAVGTDALSISEGKISRIYNSKTLGLNITVEIKATQIDGKFYPPKAGENYTTLYINYAHLSTSSVKVGDAVARGEKIGETGVSGVPSAWLSPENEHLHLEARTSNELSEGMKDRINPNLLLDIKERSGVSVSTKGIMTINGKMILK